MSSVYSIGFDIFAKDAASKVFQKLGDNVKETDSKFGSFKQKAAAGAAVAATAIIGFAAVSVNKFKQVGGEVLGLMKTMGGTSEAASRMRFAAVQSGVSFETLQKSTSKFSKALDAAKGSAKSTATMTKLLGTNFLDAHGHILPMNDLLLKVSDKFKAMPAGPEKTALAMKLFGKAGTDMLPMLNKGGDALRSLGKESDKYGLTLSGKNLQAIKDSKASQREWNATLDGLKVQIGAQVLPIMNKLVGFIRSKVIPVIIAITGFFQKHSNVIKMVAAVVVPLIAGLKAWSIAQGILNAVMAMNPIALVVIAIAALAAGLIYAYKHSETFRTIVQGAFAGVKAAFSVLWAVIKPIFNLWVAQFKLVATVGTWLWNNALRPSFAAITSAFLLVASTIVHGAASAFGWVPGIGGKLKSAAKSFDSFRDQVNGALKGTTKSVTVHTGTSGTSSTIYTLQQISGLLSQIRSQSVQDIVIRGGTNAPKKGFASGTNSAPAGLAWVGEHGPELMNMRGGEQVIPHGASMAMAAGGGSQSITVNLVLDGNVIHQALLKVKRGKGGMNLGIA